MEPGWKDVENSGPTEIRTRIAGFKVQSANHYTIGPDVLEPILKSDVFLK